MVGFMTKHSVSTCVVNEFLLVHVWLNVGTRRL